MTKLVKIVWQNKSNKQKCVTIPKSSDIEAGDAVEIRKMEVKQNGERTNDG